MANNLPLLSASGRDGAVNVREGAVWLFGQLISHLVLSSGRLLAIWKGPHIFSSSWNTCCGRSVEIIKRLISFPDPDEE